MGEMTLDDLKEHWEKAGRQFPHEGKVTPTSRDPFLGKLEEDNIRAHLTSKDYALDIGCGDGFHTFFYAQKVKRMSAVDIADSLVELARKRMLESGLKNVEVRPGSVLGLADMFGRNKFDVVISQRCLVNLPSWKYQQDAVLQVREVLKPGGLFLLTEGFQEELNNINEIRRKVGLDEIVTVAYNRNLSRQEFESWTGQYFDVVETRDYGVYLFVSRVVHPLAVKPDLPKHDGRINEAGMQIARQMAMPGFRGFSYNLFYVLRKK